MAIMRIYKYACVSASDCMSVMNKSHKETSMDVKSKKKKKSGDKEAKI